MRFRVDGVYRKRPPTSFEVHADSEGDARRAAEAAGIAVLAIFPEGAVAPPPLALPSHPDTAGGIGGWLLLFGQVVSGLGCIASAAYAFVVLAWSRATPGQVWGSPNPTVWLVGGAILAFLYSAAMFVVFTRCKQIPAE